MQTEQLLSQLNPRQREAVLYTKGPLLVLAGAGSGKTRVLTYKFAYLVASGLAQPWQILAVTFTNKAAREMKERVWALLGSDINNLHISTFHSYGVEFLYRYTKEVGEAGIRVPFSVFDRGDSQKLVERLMKDFNIDKKRFDASFLMNMISKAKASADPKTLSPNATLEARWREFYDAYNKELKRQGALDFDDLLLLPLHLLTTNKNVLLKERARFKWVLVDEYQDVNTPQYKLIELLAKSGNIMVVGDPDQSIYGWRGADMSIIMNFERDFPGAKVITLDQNYRSTGMILDAANAVIKNNIERRPKDLWTANQQGTPITVYLANTDRMEAQFIADEIRKLCRSGYSFDDIAVLYRINAMSRSYEQDLMNRGIPYKIVKGVSFYERKEVKDVLSFMRLAVNPWDAAALHRIGNVPSRGLGAKSLEAFEKSIASISSGHEDPLPLWEEVHSSDVLPLKGKAKAGARELAGHMIQILSRSGDVADVISYIMEEMGYGLFLREQYPEDWESRSENIYELLSVNVEGGDLAKFLSIIALYSDADVDETSGSRVNLLTLHAAKGLEFPVVFLVGMEENIFPHSRAKMSDSELEEERRLCYVGMTRAMEKLYLTGAQRRMLFGNLQYNAFSRFLEEIPDRNKVVYDLTLEEEEVPINVGRRSNRRHWGW
ncbi:DNA helicase-2 / ATP-dependent DNA helicase PcrA [Acetomicrobium thermoterrenum DSM 13490]|uniref:DNA 3'-5' helicase n=1 Tax=Acetomicrobium thermoterrenum DSM 13490 TaxID=1120987 RepID=A0A1H3E662_9BACT|nr:UvrD-helicase domain-containing protein [Acetomicrobium thermoterrenum]SDX73379.1 DNA helicase-2 / ATP-dependent DNA helicase PcrA [Acetomicrobium thermoterrenum DSM 13490]